MRPTKFTGFRRWFNSANKADTLLHVCCQPCETQLGHPGSSTAASDTMKPASILQTAAAQEQLDAEQGAANPTEDGHAFRQSQNASLESLKQMPEQTPLDQDERASSPKGLVVAATARQPTRTYHAHAVVLCAHSTFFEASLSEVWQQQQHQQDQHQVNGQQQQPPPKPEPLQAEQEQRKQHLQQEEQSVTDKNSSTVVKDASCPDGHVGASIILKSDDLQKDENGMTAETPIGSSASTQTSPSSRLDELTLTIQPDEWEAMDLLLRFMYGFDLPAASPDTAIHLLHCLRLADRFDVPHCVETLLSTCKDLAMSVELLQFACAAPPGVTAHPDFQDLLANCKESAQRFVEDRYADQGPWPTGGDQTLLDACKYFIANIHGDVPAIIKSKQLRREFCSLPFSAALAWAESDELQVHSENCVVYLLSAWVKAAQQPGGQGVTVEQLEQLSRQVRVLHLGPAYQHYILPKLCWFKDCCNIEHLPTLLAYKGKDVSGKTVFPAPGTDFHEDFMFDIPKQWVSQPRKQARVTDADWLLTWEVQGEQLQKLLKDEAVRSDPLYLGGFMIGVLAEPERCYDAKTTLGLFTQVHHMQEHWGTPWPAKAVVLCGGIGTRVTQQGPFHSQPPRALRGYDSLGTSNILSESAPTMAELLAPYLRDGKLHVEVQFTNVDQP